MMALMRIGVAMLAMAAWSAGAANEEAVARAKEAAQSWLALADAGKYVVIQYTTRFANKADATETVTPMRETDGSWKVSGYFIK